VVEGAAQTVTLLFTDIVGSTQLWETKPAAMSTALARHDQIVREAIEGSRGEVFKTVGDAFCAVFADAGDAVAAAVSVQLTLAAEPWPDHVNLRVRMGIHSGACERRDDDYFGPTVNRAARLQAVAHGGQVVCSQATADALRASPSSRVELRDLGEHRLKDLSHPEHVYQLEVEGLQVEFPPLRSVDNPETGNNLPARLTRFVGRGPELSTVRELLSTTRLVTLTGAGGCGKTSLAMEAAGDLDGAWLVDLSSVSDEEQVAPALGSVLGVRGQPGRTITDVIVETLSDRRITVVLDNCEHLVEACAKIVDAILRSCRQIRVLATSREALGIDGEAVYRVPSLSLPASESQVDVGAARASEAVELFVERAGSHRPGFELDEGNVAAVVEICRRLDGMPLALELAATRLQSFTIEELEENLNDRFRLLSKGRRTAVPRHQTLRALVAWSYDLLAEVERAVLRRASVFTDGFTTEEAEAVLADEGDRIWLADVLASLVDKSLMQLDETAEPLVRYRLLETIRQFAAEELVEQGEDSAVRSAHADAFLSLAETASSHLWKDERPEWMARLNADRNNLRAAIDYLLSERTAGDRAMRFVMAMARYWEMTGQVTQVLGIGRVLLAHPGTKKHDALWVRAVAALALVWRGDNWELAVFEPEVRDAFELARRLEMNEEAAILLFVLAGHATRQGGRDVGTEQAEQAISLARQSGDPTTLALTLIASSVSYMHDTEAAYIRLLEAESCLRVSGDSYWRAILSNNLGALDFQNGRFEAGRQRLRQGLDLTCPDDDVVTSLLANLGELDLVEGQPASSRRSLSEAVAIQLRTGCMNHTSGFLVSGLAMCASALSENDQAAYLHGAARSIAFHSGFEHEGEDYEGMIDKDQKRLVTQFGEAAFEAAFSRGAALTPRAALQAALSWARDSISAQP
jgi:predicted ATPase/class 3 adenylate cyclase